MSDTPDQSFDDAIDQKDARLAEQEAAIQRERAELAEIKRLKILAAKHNLVLSAAPAFPKDSTGVETVADLVERYRTDARSRYHQIRFNVRQNYDSGIRRIVKDAGRLRIADLNAATIQRLYEEWSAGGKLAQGRALVGKLRLVSGFGVTVLEDEACMRLSSILHKMRFARAKKRSESVTESYAKAIRAKAHEMGRPSIALAQAFQFDLPLKQTDVIGQWAPNSESGVGVSDVLKNGMGKWIRGIRWEEIDENLILHHVTSMHQKQVELDLKRAPMVMEELKKIGKPPSRGPVIVSELDGKPWSQNEFRRWWRKIANAAGVPDNVKNRDSSRAVGSNENRSREAPVSL
jgi:hypothetical protein